MQLLFNQRLKQIVTLGILFTLLFFVFKSLLVFAPGILGAITLYILSREKYFQLIYKRKWKKSWAALGYVFFYLLLLGIPFYLAYTLISPKINAVIANPTATFNSIKEVLQTVQEKIGVTIASEKSLNESLNKVMGILPTFINSTANLISNIAVMLFLLYYMLYHGSIMERTLYRFIPLKDVNTNLLAQEGKRVVKSNALGLPIISIIQGVAATVGYLLFGIEEWALWGFITGVFAFFPVVGTMIVWVPLVIFQFAVGNTNMGIGLLIYSIVVTGNVDYLARITVMKKMGDVHPVITVLGVIVGFELFGFIGLIFGPLLVSYAIVLFKIYMNEYVEDIDAGVQTVV